MYLLVSLQHTRQVKGLKKKLKRKKISGFWHTQIILWRAYIKFLFFFGLYSDECIGVCIPIYIYIVHQISVSVYRYLIHGPIYTICIYIYISYTDMYIYIYIVCTICIYIGICIPVYIHAYIDKYIYRYIRYVYIYTYRIPVYRYRYIYTYRIRYRLLYVNIVYKFGLHSDECIGVCIPIYIHIVHGYRLFYINIIYKFE